MSACKQFQTFCYCEHCCAKGCMRLQGPEGIPREPAPVSERGDTITVPRERLVDWARCLRNRNSRGEYIDCMEQEMQELLGERDGGPK